MTRATDAPQQPRSVLGGVVYLGVDAREMPAAEVLGNGRRLLEHKTAAPGADLPGRRWRGLIVEFYPRKGIVAQ